MQELVRRKRPPELPHDDCPTHECRHAANPNGCRKLTCRRLKQKSAGRDKFRLAKFCPLTAISAATGRPVDVVSGFASIAKPNQEVAK